LPQFGLQLGDLRLGRGQGRLQPVNFTLLLGAAHSPPGCNGLGLAGIEKRPPIRKGGPFGKLRVLPQTSIEFRRQ
jgi:hypothetical protein